MDLEFLKNCMVFNELEEVDLNILVPLFKKREIKAGKTVFIENMPGESLYLIEEGQVEISKMLAEGDEQPLVSISQGEVFGELAIMDDAPRSVTARVAEDSILWCIEKSNFDLLCRDHPSTALHFTQNLMRLFCKRIRDNHQDYREMILVGAGRKTA